MPNRLVIVESPAKAKTINKYLGKGYTVKASMGHVRDLPKSKLGVDVENGFEIDYEILPTRKKIMDELKKAAKDADEVFLAADPDREGEAICWHLAQELGGKKKTKGKSKFQRVVFHEITKTAIQKAFEHPEERSMRRKSMRSRPAAFSTAWWDTKFRRSSGTRSAAVFLPAASNPLPCA